MKRDEHAILRAVLEHAGFRHSIDESRGFPMASFSCSFPELPESTSYLLDAPAGWLRLATNIEARDLAIPQRHGLGLLYTQTGFGHIHYDAPNGLIRIAASIPAIERDPMSSALIAMAHHLAQIRHAITTGDGDVRAVDDPSPLPDEPTLDDVARTFEKTLSLMREEDGSIVGGLSEPRSQTQVALRLHTATPGIFALDAWALPPARATVDQAMVEDVDRFNTTLSAGAMLLFPDGPLVYRWACPYRWIDLAELEVPIPAQTALDAFMRWRKTRS
jgi:hypothetical protein